MDSTVAALWTFVGTVVLILTTAAATLGPLLVSRQKKKLELDETRLAIEIDELKRRASDRAVLAIEDQTKGKPLAGVDRVNMAMRIADDATPSHVKVDNLDVRAAVTRMKASMPARDSQPVPVNVTVVSSVPPESDHETRITLPRPPGVPRDPSKGR